MTSAEVNVRLAAAGSISKISAIVNGRADLRRKRTLARRKEAENEHRISQNSHPKAAQDILKLHKKWAGGFHFRLAGFYHFSRNASPILLATIINRRRDLAGRRSNHRPNPHASGKSRSGNASTRTVELERKLKPPTKGRRFRKFACGILTREASLETSLIGFCISP
jgi:hypothetical protein